MKRLTDKGAVEIALRLEPSSNIMQSFVDAVVEAGFDTIEAKLAYGKIQNHLDIVEEDGVQKSPVLAGVMPVKLKHFVKKGDAEDGEQTDIGEQQDLKHSGVLGGIQQGEDIGNSNGQPGDAGGSEGETLAPIETCEGTTGEQKEPVQQTLPEFQLPEKVKALEDMVITLTREKADVIIEQKRQKRIADMLARKISYLEIMKAMEEARVRSATDEACYAVLDNGTAMLIMTYEMVAELSDQEKFLTEVYACYESGEFVRYEDAYAIAEAIK